MRIEIGWQVGLTEVGLSEAGLNCLCSELGSWPQATVVGERAGRPWLLCAPSSRRCVCGALLWQRECGGWRTPRCSMRESCAPILHSHPARLLIWLGAAHGGGAIKFKLL